MTVGKKTQSRQYDINQEKKKLKKLKNDCVFEYKQQKSGVCPDLHRLIHRSPLRTQRVILEGNNFPLIADLLLCS